MTSHEERAVRRSRRQVWGVTAVLVAATGIGIMRPDWLITALICTSICALVLSGIALMDKWGV